MATHRPGGRTNLCSSMIRHGLPLLSPDCSALCTSSMDIGLQHEKQGGTNRGAISQPLAPTEIEISYVA